MMRPGKFKWLTLTLLTIFVCRSVLAAEPKKESGKVTYDEVLPILLLRCAACHGLRRKDAGLDVRSRQSLLRGGKSGPAIVLRNAQQSLLVKRILAKQMPPRRLLKTVSVKPMEESELRKLMRWIDQGAPQPPARPDVATTVPDPMVSDQDREYWSFQPPRLAKVPQFPGETRNAIDAFVLRKLRAAGGAFSARASRATLIRRATYDLTGLPPSPEQVAAFLADRAPRAYERLIERLLASTRYGERWGRYWLDLAGYSDSEGVQNSDRIRPEAFRYRDYVIRAFNQDKSYDQFLVEQLAGDELVDYKSASQVTPDIYDKLVATGFLRMTPDGTYFDITNFVPDRWKVIAGQIEVLTSATMGLTLQCCRCHDHKFDPIPQRDYYRLVAVFKGALDEHDWMKSVSRYLPHVTPAEKQARDRKRYAINHEINTLRDKLAVLKKRANEGQFVVHLQKYPATLRQQLRKLLATPKEQRSDTQIALAARYEKELLASRNELARLDKEFRRVEAATKARMKKLKQSLPQPAGIRAAWDRGSPSPTFILKRGDYRTPGRRVGPGVPSVLTDGKTPFKAARTVGTGKTGRRLAFARWLTRPDHPLTARVMVNRIWKSHFEHGLVRTTEDFGASGAEPTHPELLDWLAIEFVRSGWHVKHMHRIIMTSRTYQQTSQVSDLSRRVDPDNELLARMPLRRLDAEAIRDALLCVSGQLNERPFGPADKLSARADGLVTAQGRSHGSAKLTSWRRSIYVLQRRTQPLTILENFDLPTMSPNCTHRPQSTVATQALHLLNNKVIHDLSTGFAERIVREVGTDPKKQVQRVYWLALSRPPTRAETRRAMRLIVELKAKWQRTRTRGTRSPANLALGNLCHAIMNSAEFLYID